MLISVDQSVPVYDSYAAERTRGLYNVAPRDGSWFKLDVELPVETEDWQIGMVVGPSGSGKSSLVRELVKAGWYEHTVGKWSKTQPIIEVLGHQNYEKASASLAAVGLGSVPSWLRPYQVLSTGEKFRAEMAALLLSSRKQLILDEFTSVLDRQVAQVGAGAFAKAWRRKPGRRAILVGCHYDVLDWVQPDWWVDTAEGLDAFQADRGVVGARQGSFQAAKDTTRYPGNRLAAVEV